MLFRSDGECSVLPFDEEFDRCEFLFRGELQLERVEWSRCAFDEGQIVRKFCGCSGAACIEIVLDLSCVLELKRGGGEGGG